MSVEAKLIGRRVAGWVVCLTLGVVAAKGQPVGNWGWTSVAYTNGEAASNEVLRFLDGATMHGGLQGMDTNHGLRWQHADAKKPFDLQPAHLESLQFPRAQAMTNSPNCHFRFFCGDELYGSLVGMTEETLEMNTWFGSTLKIPRAAVQTISFLPKNYEVVYEGPTEAAGWVMGGQGRQQGVVFRGGLGGNQVIIVNGGGQFVMGGVVYSGNAGGTTNWVYRDGSFVSSGVGTLARDFHLSGSASIEFDVGCEGSFNLLMQIYTSTLDRMEFNNGSFMIDFDNNPNAAPRGRRSGLPNDLGNVLLPGLLKTGHAHIAIHGNKEEGSMTVLVDGEVARRWTDLDFASAVAGGVFFSSQSPDAAKLSNFKVSEWEGRYEPDLTPITATNTDEVSFVNHDKAGGKIGGIGNNKLTMQVAGNALAIPVERVRQISFAPSGQSATAAARSQWDVRALFAGGGSVSFRLEKWDGTLAAGRSPLFGAVMFPSAAVREMDFNLDRPKIAPVRTAKDEFDALDH